jgi:hypothetical protein
MKRPRVAEMFGLVVEREGVEGAAGDQVHDEEEVPLIAPAVVDGDDVRVLEEREGLDLALEAGDAGIGGADGAVENLDGHAAIGRELRGEVHDALPAAVELVEDGVSRKGCGCGGAV